MAKGNKGATAQVQAATNVQGNQAKPSTLQVKQGVNLRGARAAWYAVLLQYNGQPVATWLQHCAANPPSLPKSGVAEKPSGWLAYFVRSGVAQLV